MASNIPFELLSARGGELDGAKYGCEICSVAFPLIGLSEQSRYSMSLVARHENLYN